MKPLLIALLSLSAVCIAKPAHASHHRHHHPFHRTGYTSKHHHHYAHRHHGVRYAHRGSGSATGRPSAWCGFAMRQWLGVADTAFNLAAHWVHWGHPASPAPGAVVVYPHHVAQIVGPCHDGGCVMRSGNDGNAIRTRWRKLAGNIGVRQQ